MLDSFLKKWEALSHEPRFSKRTENFNHLGGVLSQILSQGEIQIHPIIFAEKHNIELVFLLDVLIFGTKLGLFEVSFRQICPGCGGAEFTVPSLEKISSVGHHCTICQVHIDVVLDEQIEVIFTLAKEFQSKEANSYKNADTFRSHFFSPSLERSRELLSYSKERLVRVEILPPKTKTQITFSPLTGAKLYRLLSVKNHSQVSLSVDKDKGLQKLAIEVRENGFSLESALISEKEIQLNVTNMTSEYYPLTVIKTDFDVLHKILKDHPNTMRQFFSAKDLINLQTFREHFRFETLSSEFCLPIRNMTVLFTDIKGSAELYEEKGDPLAYLLVRKHLQNLTEQTRNQMGCVVKTLGDSVMATFSKPKDAILAALAMQEITYQTTHNRDGIRGLKIGIHEGEVLVVNAESKLDFFGQTINLAARLKDQAQTGDICLTPRVLSGEGVREILTERKWLTESFQSQIKGFSEPLTLERVHLSSKPFKKVA